MSSSGRPRRFSRLLVVAMVVVSVAGACYSEKGNPGSAGSGDNPRKGASSGSNEVNPTDRADVKDGGTLQWALTSMPANFNANELDGADTDTLEVMSSLMPRVFDFKADSTPTLNKNYFDSAELTTKDSKQVVTYRINPKARWSDGKPITAADLIAQWTALKSSGGAFNVATIRGYDHVESVTQGRNDREAIVRFKAPYPDWPGLFAPLYPASTNGDPAVFNAGWIARPLVSAGPFKFSAFDEAAAQITVVRDDDWWGDKAKLDQIVFRAIDAEAQIDALTKGEIDFTDIGPDVDKLGRAESTPGLEIRRGSGPNFRHMDFNGTSEVLADVQVRRAVGLSIDRAAIAKDLIGPLGVSVVPLNNHVFMANQRGYENNAGELATPDPDKAKRLLDSAGWKAATPGAIRQKDGKPLAIRFVIPSEVRASQREGDLAAGMLKDVGIDLEIDVVPSDDFFEKYVVPGNFDMTVFSWIGTPFPISSAQSIYTAPAGGQIRQNYSRIGSAAIDKLFAGANVELDPAEAVDLANQADTLVWDEVHSLTLYQGPDIVGAKKTLANYGALGFATVRYEDIGFTA